MRPILRPAPRFRPALLTLLLSTGLSACTRPALPSQSALTPEIRLREAASASGVSGLQIQSQNDGGLKVTGSIREVPFTLRVPKNWNDQSLLFAHGYVTPSPGATEKVPDPQTEPSFGVLNAAYNQGFLSAATAYPRVGYAVKGAVEANEALRAFLSRAGSRRAYMMGISMGGSVTVASVERSPEAYAGALSVCGVTPGWRSEMRYVIDFWLVYDALTRGTPYALPGDGDFRQKHSVLTREAILQSMSRLFQAAVLRGDPQAKRLIADVARVTGADPDPVSFSTPLVALIYGLPDLLSAAGGVGYSNVDRVYTGSSDDAALNAAVMRLSASPESSAFLDANYTATGRFEAKLLTVHNLSDPLVPFRLSTEFAGIVERAGNSANLVQQVVDAKPVNLTDIASSGPGHCYFTSAEIVGAWNELRGWVEQGVRPTERNITQRP